MIGKLLLVSIVLATVAIPIRAARRRRGARTAVVWWVIFTVLWGLACLYVHPRIS